MQAEADPGAVRRRGPCGATTGLVHGAGRWSRGLGTGGRVSGSAYGSPRTNTPAIPAATAPAAARSASGGEGAVPEVSRR